MVIQESNEVSNSVLLIEDDLHLRGLLAELLEEEGFAVKAMPDGESAVAQADDLDFNILVTDVRLPGEDGLEILGRLRAKGKRFRSIIITGYSDITAAPRAIQRGASDFLYKPFDLSELLDTVQRVADEESEVSQYEADHLWLLKTYLEARDTQCHRIPADDLLGLRSQAFKGYYVAVRSRKLDPYEARYIYAQLEDLEQELLSWCAGKSLPDLGRGYQRVMEDIGSVTEQGGLLFVVPELPDALAFDVYNVLHQKIWKGKIEGFCPLLLAPLLRLANPSHSRWGEIRDRLWDPN